MGLEERGEGEEGGEAVEGEGVEHAGHVVGERVGG